MCAASRRGASTSSSRASGCGSPRARSAGSARRSTSTSRRSGRGRWRARYPYLFLDAKVEKVRDGGRVVNKALVIAHGVHETGRREILSIDVGEAETEAFWTEFLRGLVKRGLVGVQLAISDAHAGLKAAIAKVLGLRLAALHRPLPARLPRPRAQGPARPAGRADPADLQRRLASAGARPALGSGRAPRRPDGQGRRDARGRRARHPRLLRVPGRSLAQAAGPPIRSSASTARSAGAPTSSASSPTTAR